jgi:hypothetical protein
MRERVRFDRTDQLSHGQQVSTIGRAIGRSLRMEEVSAEEWRKVWVPNWPVPAVNMLLDAWARRSWSACACDIGGERCYRCGGTHVPGMVARSFRFISEMTLAMW